MKPIGVTQRVVVEPRTREVRLALDVRWSSFLAACGLFAVPLPLEPDLAWRVVRRTGCAGLLLTGGNDLGESPERDALEHRLLDSALSLELPVVGVCRGMQLMLTAFGGALERVDGHVACTHRLDTGRVVNSYHQWAAFDAPAEFDVLARHECVVEAVRHRCAPATGVMWHPERTSPFDQQDLALFTQLFGSSHESRHPLGGARVSDGSTHRGSAEMPAGGRWAHVARHAGRGAAPSGRR